jgi:hypothetical protein
MGFRTPKQNNELKTALEEDFVKAQGQAEKTEGALGVAGSSRRTRRDPSSFTAKGIRVGGKIIGQKELADSEKAINKTIESLVKRNKFKTQQEEFKFRTELKDKFNKTRTLIIKAGLKFDQTMANEQMEFQNRMATINMFGGFAKGIGTFAGHSMGRSGSLMGAESGNVDPNFVGDPEGEHRFLQNQELQSHINLSEGARRDVRSKPSPF